MLQFGQMGTTPSSPLPLAPSSSSPLETSSPEHAANQQTGSNKRARAGRGISKRSHDVWTITELEPSGAPLLPSKAAAKFRTTCGIVARTHVPITIESWKSVTEQEKQRLWEEVRRSFVFPSESIDAVRRNALLRMGNAWRNFKCCLVNQFINEEKEPFQKYPFLTQEMWDEFVSMKTTHQFKESSATHKAISQKNTHPHRLGASGYARKILEWERAGLSTQSDGTSTPFGELRNPRAKYWYLARVKTTAKGETTFVSAKTKDVCKKLVELDRQASQGSFQQQREQDILSEALGNKEHPGRTRGVGVYVPWKHGFPNDPNYRKRKSIADIQNAIVEKTRVEWEPRIRRLEAMLMDRQEDMLPPEARDATQMQHRSSCMSAPTLDEINAWYPIDHIKDPTPCKLYIRFGGTISIEAGIGVAYPCLPGMTIHGVQLTPGFAKVQVDQIQENMMVVPLVKPLNDDVIVLRDAINSFVQWPKKDIMLENHVEHSTEAPEPTSPMELEQPVPIMLSKSQAGPHTRSKTNQPQDHAVSLRVKGKYVRKGTSTKKSAAEPQKLQIQSTSSMELEQSVPTEAPEPTSPMELEQPVPIMLSKSEAGPHTRSKTNQPQDHAVSLRVKGKYARKGTSTKKSAAEPQKLQIQSTSSMELEQPVPIMPSKSQAGPRTRSKTSQPQVHAVSLGVKGEYGRKGASTKKAAKPQKLQISTQESMPPLVPTLKWKFKLRHPMVNDAMLVPTEAEKEASTEVPRAVYSPSRRFN